MKILYVRISTLDQKTDRQKVNAAEYDMVIEDIISGAVPFQERLGIYRGVGFNNLLYLLKDLQAILVKYQRESY
jgi:DNA invertase Pin-like site-specific DNA recombinase